MTLLDSLPLPGYITCCFHACVQRESQPASVGWQGCVDDTIHKPFLLCKLLFQKRLSGGLRFHPALVVRLLRLW